MPISEYLAGLREKVGTRLLLVPSVAAIVRNEDGEVLLMKSSDSRQWSLPGGAVDPGETPREAIVREVAEETGLVVQPVTVAAVLGGKEFRHTYPNGDLVEYAIVLFECRIDGGTLEAIDGEAEELQWFLPADMPQLGFPYPPHLFSAPDSTPWF